MFLQISNTDSLNEMSSSKGQTQFLVLFIVIVGLALIWFIINSSKTKKIKEINEKIKNRNSDENKNNPSGKSSINNSSEYKSKTEITAREHLNEISKHGLIPSEIVTNKVKYIGYNPTKKFKQKIPFCYPYVIMPEPACIIKYSQKGRIGQKGFTETKFKNYLESYFTNPFQLSDDDFILITEGHRPFEPDFSLINENKEINIFVDIEIDEPYEGINNIENRKPTHYQYFDSNRDEALKRRGWITIRFAELQIYQEPLGCCLFISEVLKEINPDYKIPEKLANIQKVNPIRQWTKDEAENLSKENYREKYLGIGRFNTQVPLANKTLNIKETKSGRLVEEQINKILHNQSIQNNDALKNDTQKVIEIIRTAIRDPLSRYIEVSYEGKKTIIRPYKITSGILKGECFVENNIRNFDISEINILKTKSSSYKFMERGVLDFDEIRNIITREKVQKYNPDYIRFFNSSSISWSLKDFTIEDIEKKTKCAEDVYSFGFGITIKIEQFAITAPEQELITRLKLSKNFLCAFCYRRKEMRVFNFQDIRQWEVF